MPMSLPFSRGATSKLKKRSKLKRIVTASLIAAVTVAACVVGGKDVPIRDVILNFVNAIIQ